MAHEISQDDHLLRLGVTREVIGAILPFVRRPSYGELVIGCNDGTAQRIDTGDYIKLAIATEISHFVRHMVDTSKTAWRGDDLETALLLLADVLEYVGLDYAQIGAALGPHYASIAGMFEPDTTPIRGDQHGINTTE